MWLRTDTDKPDGFYGPIAPPGPNALSSECWPNVVPNCEFRTCPDPEFLNALHSEFMNTPNVEFLTYLFVARLCHTLPAANGVIRCATIVACNEHALLGRAHSIGRGCRVHTCVMTIGADFKMYLLRQFCSNRVEFFLQ